MDLQEIKSLGIQDVGIERDSKVVIVWGLGKGDGSWSYGHFIQEIRELVMLLDAHLVHI